MKLEVGMYVRDREEGIGQVDYICDCVECLKRGYKEPVIKFKNHTEYVNSEELEKIWFIKSSFNLISLIEVGDYVNGYLVTSIEKNGWLAFGNHDWYIPFSDEIKSIVTHEQFKSMEYKV